MAYRWAGSKTALIKSGAFFLASVLLPYIVLQTTIFQELVSESLLVNGFTIFGSLRLNLLSLRATAEETLLSVASQFLSVLIWLGLLRAARGTPKTAAG